MLFRGLVRSFGSAGPWSRFAFAQRTGGVASTPSAFRLAGHSQEKMAQIDTRILGQVSGLRSRGHADESLQQACLPLKDHVCDSKEFMVIQRNMRTSIKKMLLITRLIRYLPVNEALAQLLFLKKRKSEDVIKMINHGIDKAKEAGVERDRLYVAIAMLGRGHYEKRMDFKGRGRTGLITKPHTHLTLVLRESKHYPQKDPHKMRGRRRVKNPKWPKVEFKRPYYFTIRNNTEAYDINYKPGRSAPTSE